MMWLPGCSRYATELGHLVNDPVSPRLARDSTHHQCTSLYLLQAKELETCLKASLSQWSNLEEQASLFQQWLDKAKREVGREHVGST